MSTSVSSIIAMVILVLLLGGCRSDNSSGAPAPVTGNDSQDLIPGPGAGDDDPGNDDDPDNDDNTGDDESPVFAFFSSHVHPGLAFCRACHVPGGVADEDGGDRLLLGAVPDAEQDYLSFHVAWQSLGEGVEDNLLLLKPSGEQNTAHQGSYPWPLGSAAYDNLRILLSCWDDPDNCSLLGGSEPEDLPPLLGSARGGHLWYDHCEQAGWPAEEPLPVDPRALLQPGINADKNRAVYFNAFWKDCHIDESGDGIADYLVGGYEKAHPKNCGELQASIQRGAILMGAAPFDSSVRNSFGNAIRPGSTFAADTHNGPGAISASSYNNLWQAWGLDARPPDFDLLVAERYGLGLPTENNPYPQPGESPGAGGGSGMLPSGLIQLRTESGAYSGNIGINCQGCHGVTIDDTFHYGSGGAMLDLATFGRDLEFVGEFVGAGLDRVGVAGRVRGTNNAQFSNVTALVGAFNTSNYADGFNSIFFPYGNSPFCTVPPFNFFIDCDPNQTNEELLQKILGVLNSGSTATGDTPAWWNVGRRPVKFVDGMFPGDAVRVDMALFFPLFEINFPFGPSAPQEDPFEFASQWVGEHAQYADHWLMTLKSPEYPLPVDEKLAEAGAILFHTKNLWADSLDNPVPVELLTDKGYTGNGSCASCHGVYSPRYVQNDDFLPSPLLEGTAGFVVPIKAVGTDRVRFDTYMSTIDDPQNLLSDEGSHNTGTNKANSNLYIGYGETADIDTTGDGHPDGDCRVQNLDGMQRDHLGNNRALGYAAPPLYGVWATAPYFHNGSVPDVWGVLDSRSRPNIWRRVSKEKPATWQGLDVVMGFDSSFDSFDPQRLGWRHDTLECIDSESPQSMTEGGVIPVLQCNPVSSDLPDGQTVITPVYDGVLVSWNVTNPPVLSNQDVENRKIYNTNMFSQGNGGHEFTDVLTDAERRAIIEYLKTL